MDFALYVGPRCPACRAPWGLERPPAIVWSLCFECGYICRMLPDGTRRPLTPTERVELRTATGSAIKRDHDKVVERLRG